VCFRQALEEMFTALGQSTSTTLDNIVAVHTTETQVGVTAREADAKHLVLTHFIPPVFDEERLRHAVAADYAGAITIASDLTTIDVPS
jgi:ribonuclease BN (tRNA processing enzyme)